MLQRDDIRGAAFRRHVLRICEGQLEAAPEAGMAHSVPALELGSLARQLFVVHADDALNAARGSEDERLLARSMQPRAEGGVALTALWASRGLEPEEMNQRNSPQMRKNVLRSLH